MLGLNVIRIIKRGPCTIHVKQNFLFMYIFAHHGLVWCTSLSDHITALHDITSHLIYPNIVSYPIISHHIHPHYNDVIMGAMAPQITSITIVYSTVYSGRSKKHQSSASLAFVRGIHRWPVNSPHKRPVTRKMFPFDDVFMPIPITSCLYQPMSNIMF